MTLRETAMALQAAFPSRSRLKAPIKRGSGYAVGASLKVLQKRAMDVTKGLLPYQPAELLADLATHKADNPGFGVEQVPFFTLGGIKTCAQWLMNNGGASGRPAIAA